MRSTWAAGPGPSPSRTSASSSSFRRSPRAPPAGACVSKRAPHPAARRVQGAAVRGSAASPGRLLPCARVCAARQAQTRVPRAALGAGDGHGRRCVGGRARAAGNLTLRGGATGGRGVSKGHAWHPGGARVVSGPETGACPRHAPCSRKLPAFLKSPRLVPILPSKTTRTLRGGGSHGVGTHTIRR